MKRLIWTLVALALTLYLASLMLSDEANGYACEVTLRSVTTEIPAARVATMGTDPVEVLSLSQGWVEPFGGYIAHTGTEAWTLGEAGPLIVSQDGGGFALLDTDGAALRPGTVGRLESWKTGEGDGLSPRLVATTDDGSNPTGGNGSIAITVLYVAQPDGCTPTQGVSA